MMVTPLVYGLPSTQVGVALPAGEEAGTHLGFAVPLTPTPREPVPDQSQ